jgi:hypothetical protein
MRWLWAHWELKLVSLAVAVALWTYTSGQVRVERSVLVEILPGQITELPADLRVTDVAPGQFVAVLSVPTGKVDLLRDEVLHPLLSLPRDRRSAGRVEFPLTGRSLGLDGDIRILRTEPADLRGIAVDLTQIAEATLPVEVPLVVGLPAGLVAEVVMERTRIDVRGPRDKIEAATAEGRPLRFVPVRIEGLSTDLVAPREERIILHTLPGQPEPVQPVGARITVRPARTLEVTVRVPLGVLLPVAELGRWTATEDAQGIDLRISGPEGVVRAVAIADITAWVDLRSVPLVAGDGRHPVHAQLPAGLSAAATSVHLTLKPVH